MVYPSSGAASGTHDQLGFVVEVVESMVATLRSNGVIFEEYEAPPGASATDGIIDFGGVKAAWFKDSEGNLLSIVEFVFIPRGVAHGFTNTGQEPARCLGIVTPGVLHEKLLSSLGESAKAETLPPPPEGPPDWIAAECL